MTIESHATINRRVYDVIVKKLMPLAIGNTSAELFRGRIHEFLTCRAIARRLGDDSFITQSTTNFFEEHALECVHRSMGISGFAAWEFFLLLDEMPKLRRLEYPAVDKIRSRCLTIIPQLLAQFRHNSNWEMHRRLERVLDTLE